MTVVQPVAQVRAYASCRDSKCVGYQQEPVDAVREVTSTTYKDLGGDLDFVERTHEYLQFADDEDRVCRFCDGERMVSEQVRPEYLKVTPDDPNVQQGVDPQVARLLAEQQAAIAVLTAEKQQRESEADGGV